MTPLTGICIAGLSRLFSSLESFPWASQVRGLVLLKFVPQAISQQGPRGVSRIGNDIE